MVKNNEKGITLIAVIVTIIVLLILSGVVILYIAGDDGLLSKTVGAKVENEKAVAKEELQLAVGTVGVNYYSSGEEQTLKKYILSNEDAIKNALGFGKKIQVNENAGTIKYKGYVFRVKDDGTIEIIEDISDEVLQVGDTVEYNPSGTYTWQSKYSGNVSEEDTILNSGKDEDYSITTWQVLNINKEEGTVDLISVEPSKGTVSLGNAQGYNNAVKLLNDACNSLYGNSSKGITARSINIGDIEDKMTEDALEEAYKYTSDATSYGKQIDTAYQIKKSYPKIYSNEKLSVVNGKENKDESALGISEQTNFIEKDNEGAITDAEKIQPYQTYWYASDSFMQKAFKGEGTNTSNVNYNLIMPNGTNTTYWVASRSINTGSDSCSFSVYFVNSGELTAYHTYSSDGSNVIGTSSFRPIISVKSSFISINDDFEWIIK